MKLTNKTIPQTRNYRCDNHMAILSHKNMYNKNYCYDCHLHLNCISESKNNNFIYNTEQTK